MKPDDSRLLEERKARLDVRLDPKWQEVRERAMQSLVHLQWLPSNGNRELELFIGKIRQRAQQHLPPLVPLREELRPSHRSSPKFLFPLAPWFLTIASQEVGEAGLKISRNMPADHRNGIPTVRALNRKITLVELVDGRFAESLVSKIFVTNRLDNARHNKLRHAAVQLPAK